MHHPGSVVVIPSEREKGGERDFKKGQHSQRTPWEEREDHGEEQDGTLLKQHSAEEDRYQGLHNYLPNKGHFHITPLGVEGKRVVGIPNAN